MAGVPFFYGIDLKLLEASVNRRHHGRNDDWHHRRPGMHVHGFDKDEI